MIYEIKSPDFPSMVHIPISYVCNAECIHCPYAKQNSGLRDKYAKAGTRFMTFDLFKKTVDECAEHKAFIRITGGGEPFLHPTATAFVCYAKQKGCGVGIITNGSRIGVQVADMLLGNNIDVIEFSVDAMDEEMYKKIRLGLKWKNLTENIRYVLNKRKEINSKTRVIVSVINQKLVEDKIKDIEKFWYDFGVDYVIIRKYLVYDILNERDSNNQEPIMENNENVCPYPFERIEVDVNGNIKFCLYDMSSNVVMGNIKDLSLHDVWVGKELTKIRESMINNKWDNIPFCRDCRDRKYRSWGYNYTKVLKETGVK